jgi:1-deoxy-D-xylulose-5-phosphate synthase
MNDQDYPLLSKVSLPSDLRQFPEEDLQPLADELRRYLIHSVAASGGHFGAGLGCIELTIALHYLYDTPHDRIVWDVGHQAYPHKILSGRARQITSIKKKDGLAPFPKRSESDFDTFGVGHSSTSISAALGMALGSAAQGNDRKCVAVIGDGAMTAGMAYEALNHGGDLDPNLLVVLNENQMSISPNVGAFARMLGRLMSGPTVTGIRETGKRMMRRDSRTWRFMSRWEEHIKGMVMPSTLFEELGFNYLGPIDGHDLPVLMRTIRTAKEVEGPNLLHIITAKGKGYAPAEKDPVKYHAVGPFDPEKGVVSKTPPKIQLPSYTQVFGQWLCDMAEQDPRLLAITPAMREGSGLVEFHKRFPDRYFDVGIAEQHSLTLAAGMACEGARPVVAIYSTFLQRAYDQLIHDIALQDLPVVLAIDRAGLVGPRGPTHAGSALCAKHGCDGAGGRE